VRTDDQGQSLPIAWQPAGFPGLEILRGSFRREFPRHYHEGQCAARGLEVTTRLLMHEVPQRLELRVGEFGERRHASRCERTIMHDLGKGLGRQQYG
jgi:hypothetical protein